MLGRCGLLACGAGVKAPAATAPLLMTWAVMNSPYHSINNANRSRNTSGSTSRRSHTQSRSLSQQRKRAMAERESALKLLSSLSSDAIICYTDGSAAPTNPGPCGAAATVTFPASLHPEAREVSIQQVLALGHGTNNIGELAAIGVACDVLERGRVEDRVRFDSCPGVHIFTDSTYAVGVLDGGNKAHTNRELVACVREALSRCRLTVDVRLHWVRGHNEVPGNQLVDALANRGSALSEQGSFGLFEQQQLQQQHPDDTDGTDAPADANAHIYAGAGELSPVHAAPTSFFYQFVQTTAGSASSTHKQ